MQITVRVTASDAGHMHERTYTVSASLPLTANLEQVEATAKNLLEMLADRAADDFEQMDGDDELTPAG